MEVLAYASSLRENLLKAVIDEEILKREDETRTMNSGRKINIISSKTNIWTVCKDSR